MARCHIILSNLRKPGEKGYKIPSGFLFNYITCANYFAEIMGWVCFSFATRVSGQHQGEHGEGAA